jgi:hypothetical protein
MIRTAETGIDASTFAAVHPSVLPLTCPGGEHRLLWAVPGAFAICADNGHNAAVWKVVTRPGDLVSSLVAEWSAVSRLLAETLVRLRAPEQEPAPAEPAVLTQAELDELAAVSARAVTVSAETARGQSADYPRGVNGAYRKGTEDWSPCSPLAGIRKGIEASRENRIILWKAFRARHPHAPDIIAPLVGCSPPFVHLYDRGDRIVPHEVGLRLRAIMALPHEDAS